MTKQGIDVNKETRPTIFVVDDEAVIRNAFRIYFETLGYRVFTADGGEEAIDTFRGSMGKLDVVILDLVMPGMHGIDLLRQMKSLDSTVEVIIATGCGSMSTAVEAMRHGAFDYITKPVIDLDHDLLSVVKGAIIRRTTQRRIETALNVDPLDLEPKKAQVPQSGDDRALKFYLAMEALAQALLTGAARMRPMAALSEILRQYLMATAVFLVSRKKGVGAAMGFDWEERFGPSSEFLDPERGGTLTTGALEGAIARPFVWQRIGDLSQVVVGHQAEAAAMEALCVPVGHEVSGRFLLVFRQVQDWRLEPEPEGALVGLMADLALASVPTKGCYTRP